MGRLWNLFKVLATHGRAVEMESEIREILPTVISAEDRLKMTILKFVDAVEAGRVSEAEQLEHDKVMSLPADQTVVMTFHQKLWRIRKLVLDLMNGRFESRFDLQTVLTPPGTGEIYPKAHQAGDSSAPAWGMASQALLAARPDLALDWSRHNLGLDTELADDKGFSSLYMIRSEIASRHADAARRLLIQRRERGCRHYLDDFFFARIELLQGNRPAAAQYFANAIKEVARC